jgi:hypothetical protein
MTKRRCCLLLGVAAAHLILVAIGASNMSLGGLGLLGSALDKYGALSGASSHYGFFTPGVTFQLGARFDIIDGAGVTTSASLANGASHEADIRVGNIIDQFGRMEDEGEAEAVRLRRSLAASLAGKMFARHPEAIAVVVRLETFTPVAMDAWRRGERPEWSPLYTAKFVHHPQPKVEPDHESDDG